MSLWGWQWLVEAMYDGIFLFSASIFDVNSTGKYVRCNLRSIVSRYTRWEAFHFSEERSVISALVVACEMNSYHWILSTCVGLYHGWSISTEFCLSVCRMITVGSLNIGSTYKHVQCIARQCRSSSYMKVIGWRWQEQKG